MHVLVWIATGLVAGLVARFGVSQRSFGLLGDLVLGALGGIAGGWLFRLLDLTAAGRDPGHVAASIAGAVASLGAARAVARTGQRIAKVAPALADAVQGLDAALARLGERERRALARMLGRERVARDSNVAFDEQLTLGDRLADGLASFGGSWTFLGLFGAVLLAWIAFNVERPGGFDPYPFILLNLLLSCLAAMQAPIIMMSQNRLSAKDRLQASHDYEVNLKAELEIMALHAKVDELQQREWGDLIAIQRRQLEALERIEATLGAPR